jgi:hypothetical protein
VQTPATRDPFELHGKLAACPTTCPLLSGRFQNYIRTQIGIDGNGNLELRVGNLRVDLPITEPNHVVKHEI